jgi:hypothetical protein
MKVKNVFLILWVLMSISACDKNNGGPEPVDATVTAEDLLGYQMYWGLIAPDNTVHLRFLYFEKSGDEVKATLDGITSRRILPINVQNNTITLDVNENGSVVYTFEFSKDGHGVKVASAKYYNIDNPAYRLGDNAAILPLSDFYSVKNKAFKSVNSDTLVRFNVDTWLTGEYPAMTGTYYECGVGGLKARINGVDYMGIRLIIDREIDGILLQKAGEKQIRAYLAF